MSAIHTRTAEPDDAPVGVNLVVLRARLSPGCRPRNPVAVAPACSRCPAPPNL